MVRFEVELHRAGLGRHLDLNNLGDYPVDGNFLDLRLRHNLVDLDFLDRLDWNFLDDFLGLDDLPGNDFFHLDHLSLATGCQYGGAYCTHRSGKQTATRHCSWHHVLHPSTFDSRN